MLLKGCHSHISKTPVIPFIYLPKNPVPTLLQLLVNKGPAPVPIHVAPLSHVL